MAEPPRPLKFIQQQGKSVRLEVQFSRSRKVQVTVQEGSTCGKIVERLCKHLVLDDTPTDYRVYVESVGFMQPSDVLPPQCLTIQLRRTPSRLLFVVEADAAGGPVASSAELQVDLSSVPRDVLPALRTILGGRREAVLMRASGHAELLNFSLSFERQGVEAGCCILLLSVAALLRRTLSSFKPSVSGWLQKRSNVLTHRRFALVAERCLMYFKTDGPASLPAGLVPLDYYGVATFEDNVCHVRLANPTAALGVPLKPMYDFVADDGNASWGRALLDVKNFPRVFGVPYQWNPEAAETAVQMLTEFLEGEAAAHLLPGVFGHAMGAKTEVAWMAELFDSRDTAFDQVLQVMRGCDVRSVLALFRKYLNMQPVSLLPSGLSRALLTVTRDHAGAADETMAAALVGVLRQPDPADKPGLIASFHAMLCSVLSFLHKCWQHSKANGATTTLIGRCFGHSLCSGLDSLSDCALVTTTLVKLAPLIGKGLREQSSRRSRSTPAAAQWRCTLELASAVTLETQEVFFQFPDVTDSTLMEAADLDNLSPRDNEDYCVAVSSPPPPAAVAVVLTLEQRVALLETALLEERSQRLALEGRVAHLQDEVAHLAQSHATKSPSTQRDTLLQAIQIGRQRTKSAASDCESGVNTPELPLKRGGSSRTLVNTRPQGAASPTLK